MMTSLTRSASKRASAILSAVAFLQAVETEILGAGDLSTIVNVEVEEILTLVQTMIATTLDAINFACVI